MTLEIKAELMKLSDGMQNCDIYQKFNFSASTVPTLPQDKSRILEIVRKASPLLFTVTKNRDGSTAEMENIPIVWVHDYTLCCVPLNEREIQAKTLFPMLICFVSGNKIDAFYFLLAL
jgi:hypothetical protein